MKKILVGIVWATVFAVSIPVALVIGVVRGGYAAFAILNWPDEVCERLEKISPFSMLLVVASAATTTMALNLIWSSWHAQHEMFASLRGKIGCTAAGFFIYLAGLALFFIAIRPKKKNLTARKLFYDIFQL